VLGSGGNLGENAQTVRFASYGVTDLALGWRFAPAVTAQVSENR
jgi:sucrose porin